MMNPQTLKGFRDYLPGEAVKRQYVIDTLKSVFATYGFEPLETPTLEYEEILAGKYGDEGEKLMYRFEDLGGRKVAMRYDQTVPLARVVAQYQNDLPFPFKRYQIQPVWRAENTQRGRLREFLQCDIDTIGTTALMTDAEIIACVIESIQKLGFKSFKVLINDRNIFSNFKTSFPIESEKIVSIIRAIDKLKKIGREGVLNELVSNDFTQDQADEILTNISNTQTTDNIKELLTNLQQLGISDEFYKFEPTLARGLDYYTGIIFEVELPEYTAGSLGGGGRYDNLIGMYAGRQIPAVGFAFGFDRIIEAMEQLNLFPTSLRSTQVLVTVFSPELKEKAIEISSHLRSNDINTELYLDDTAKMEKQLKYADKKGIPYVIIIGPEEAAKNVVQLKNLQSREQKEMTIEETIKTISNS